MKATPLFPGWYVVGAAHLLLALVFGAAYSFGVLFTDIQSHFGEDRFSTASAFSITALIYYAVGALSGALSDRTSVRMIAGMGILLLSLGFWLGSLVESSFAVFLVTFCALVGVGVGLVYVPAVTTVQRWFVARRSTASGITLAGTGVGTLLGPPAVGLALQHLSWQSTMRVCALFILALGLVAACFLWSKPESFGLQPDGADEPASGPRALVTDPRSLTLIEAARQASFWWYFAAILLGSVGLFMALIHISLHAQQHGMPMTQAHLLIGLIGAGNVAGRLGLGRLADRLGALRLLVMLTVSLSLLCILWATARDFHELAAFALLFGVANGGCIALYPAVAATWFGTRNLGAILGALFTAVGLAAVAGGSLAGFMFDVFGTYQPSIALAGLCAIASMVALLLAAKYRLNR